jgi:hypothetical protein
MADTVRSRAALLTLLADNSTGNISAQDLRDTLVSLHGVYGALYTLAGSGTMTLSSTAATFDQWAANGLSSGTTPDYTTADGITVGSDGVYLAQFNVSLSASTDENIYFRLAVDGTAGNYGCQLLDAAAAGDVLSAGCAGLLTLSAAQVVTVRVSATSTPTITVYDANLVLHRIA